MSGRVPHWHIYPKPRNNLQGGRRKRLNLAACAMMTHVKSNKHRQHGCHAPCHAPYMQHGLQVLQVLLRGAAFRALHFGPSHAYVCTAGAARVVLHQKSRDLAKNRASYGVFHVAVYLIVFACMRPDRYASIVPTGLPNTYTTTLARSCCCVGQHPAGQAGSPPSNTYMHM